MEGVREKDLLYNDYDAKMKALQKKKRKRKKRRRRRRILFLIIFLSAMVSYFLSDVSKIKSIVVSGNRIYSDEQIQQLANISYETRYIVCPSFWMKWNIEKGEMIASAEVKKKIDGSVHITVEEKKAIGYVLNDDGTKEIVLDSGEKVKMEDDFAKSMMELPLISGFDDEQLEKLAKSIKTSKKEITQDSIGRISEIVAYAESYDEHMVKLLMQDGNTIYTSYGGMRLFPSYDAVLKELEGKDVCLFFEEATDVVAKMECPE